MIITPGKNLFNCPACGIRWRCHFFHTKIRGRQLYSRSRIAKKWQTFQTSCEISETDQTIQHPDFEIPAVDFNADDHVQAILSGNGLLSRNPVRAALKRLINFLKKARYLQRRSHGSKHLSLAFSDRTLGLRICRTSQSQSRRS